MSTGSGQPPGWYYAQGDPPGTHRYWDGEQWVGGPQPVSASPGAGAFGGMPAPAYGSGFGGGVAGAGLADPWVRIGARLIDFVIMFAVAFVIALVVGVEDNQVGLQLMFAAAGVIYEVGFTALKGGTPGKLILGIGVTTTAGLRPPGWGPAVIRWVVTAIPCVGIVVFIVSLVFLFTDAQHRTVGDRAASTLVVRTK
jgi:uncharacterized RDD family membrane protein YckC